MSEKKQPRSVKFWTLTGIAAVITAVGTLVGTLYGTGIIGGGSAEYTLFIDITGQGNTIPSPGTHIYDKGDKVTVVADPDDDCSFTGWEGDTSGSRTTVVVTMDRDKTIIANFTEAQPYEELPVPWVYSIPDDWYLSVEESYGSYETEDGHLWGLLEYTDDYDGDFVQIYYGGVPADMKSPSEKALIGKAIYYLPVDHQEAGSTVVSGQLAGFALAYDEEYQLMMLSIVFVKESVYINALASYYYDENDENYNQVLYVIDHIDF